MGMNKIRIISTGPNTNHTPGQVLEVDPARAAALIAGGYAEPADVQERSPGEEVKPGAKPKKVK